MKILIWMATVCFLCLNIDPYVDINLALVGVWFAIDNNIKVIDLQCIDHNYGGVI
jgi:hypothetical protein